MKKICGLLLILILLGTTSVWGAKTPPNIVGTWEGTTQFIWGENEKPPTAGMKLIIDRQVDSPLQKESLFLGRMIWPDFYTGPDYVVSGTIDKKGNIRINGGVTDSALSGIYHFEFTGKLTRKQGLREITGDWREIDFFLSPQEKIIPYTGSMALTESQ